MSTILHSLVLVTVDCLRADHVGWLGYDRPTTPFLDSLASHSLVFSNAIVGGVPTYYSFPAIMASRPALALGRDVVGLSPGEPTIASQLRQSGYATAAFIAGNPYLSRQFGYDFGFDTFEDFLDSAGSKTANDSESKPTIPTNFNKMLREASRSNQLAAALYDELYFQYCQRRSRFSPRSFDDLRRFPAAHVIVERAISWLKQTSGVPYFLWLHFMDSHSPYYPCEPALKGMGGSLPDPSRARYLNACWNRSDLGARRRQRYREPVIALYDAGVRWVDEQLSVLVSSLRSAGRWENSALAVTADHGEEFLEHGGRYHSPAQSGEELIRVPLLLHLPGAGKPAMHDAPFSLLNLAPTLLDAMGVAIPASFRGVSRRSQLREGTKWDEPAIVESASNCTNPLRTESRMNARLLVVREQRYKLVIDFSQATENLFDLDSDPRELYPLPVTAEKGVRHRLLKFARQHVSSSIQRRDERSVMDSRLRDIRLEWAGSGAISG